MEKTQVLLEYKAAVVALKKATKSNNKQLVESAKKILKDKTLFAEYLAIRIEKTEKKMEKANNKPSIWSKCFSIFKK